MAEHRLNTPQVGAALKQVGGEAMAKDVRGETAVESGGLGVLSQIFPEALSWPCRGR
jgi:hypothetical protein